MTIFAASFIPNPFDRVREMAGKYVLKQPKYQSYDKKILFFDMDGVLVDFKSGIAKLDKETKQEYGKHYDSAGVFHDEHYDDVPGIFALMDPIDGAKEAVEILAKKYDVYILSTAPWKNPTACNDKLAWVKKHFDVDGDEKRISFTNASSSRTTKTFVTVTISSMTDRRSVGLTNLQEKSFISARLSTRIGIRWWSI